MDGSGISSNYMTHDIHWYPMMPHATHLLLTSGWKCWYSRWCREILHGDHPWFWMFIKPDVNQRETTYQACSLNCWVVFITGPRFWTDHHQQGHGGTISFGVQFLGPKRRSPHDILCSPRHQMTSGEELVVKSRKAVGVAVAMQIWVEVLAAIARKHILREATK